MTRNGIYYIFHRGDDFHDARRYLAMSGEIISLRGIGLDAISRTLEKWKLNFYSEINMGVGCLPIFWDNDGGKFVIFMLIKIGVNLNNALNYTR